MASPFLTHGGLLERAPHLVHLFLHNDPMVVGYQFWGASSINNVYGNPAGSGVGGSGPAALFQATSGDLFRSPRIRRKGLALVPENRRGQTQVAFDPDDYTIAGMAMTVPLDEQYLYVRVQENRNGVGLLNFGGVPANPVLGGIYVVPPPEALGLTHPTFTIQANAPSATGCAAGLPPVFDEDLTAAAPRPMYLVFPFPLIEFTLRNLDGANDLLVSFGPGQVMMTVPAGTEAQLYSGGTKEMVLACPDAGGCPFGLHGVLNRGS